MNLDSAQKTNRRVLLTGARGFTGHYVRAELEATGFDVIGAIAAHAESSAAELAANEIELDITSLEQCRAVMQQTQPDYLVHLAAQSFVHQANPEPFYQVNVIGSINLLQALADCRLTPRAVLIASSANVYGNSNAGVIDEAQPPQPVNHYAVSKIAMEYLARTWFDRLPIVITRPFNYTGIGQAPHFLVPKIVDHFKRRDAVIELGNLDVERDFSDVRMVASAYRKLLLADAAGQVVNICSGQPYSLQQIIESMQSIAGYEIEVRVNPAFVRQSEVKTLVGSPALLQRLIGDPGVIALPDTLRWMMRE